MQTIVAIARKSPKLFRISSLIAARGERDYGSRWSRERTAIYGRQC
jgi:hypothetical protein